MRNFRIDDKHSIIVPIGPDGTDHNSDPLIAKRTTDGNFIPIPTNEPVILFRARDKLAVPMLKHYRELCRQDGCTDFQLASMNGMIDRFEAFASDRNTAGKMKQPGCTKGK